MNTNRFDHFIKRVASRRMALRAGGLGLLGGLVGTRTLAQNATPAVDPHDPHPDGDHTGADPEFLFVQPFESGTWKPKPGTDGMYTLTLSGADANTIYFSDRPERITGLAPTQQFLDGLGFTPDNPPNAAIVAARADGPAADGSDHEVLVIELFNPVYDADAETLTYDAAVLADYGEPGLAHLADQQRDYEIGETFGEGSLFIDDCPPAWHACIDQAASYVEYGAVQVPQFWDRYQCYDNATPEDICNRDVIGCSWFACKAVPCADRPDSDFCP